jgi:hypothetical protein
MKNSAPIWFAKMKIKDGPAFSEHLLDCKVRIIVAYTDDSFFITNKNRRDWYVL